LKLLFLVTEDWYFVSHRIQLARAARDAGADVVVMCHCTNFHETLVKEGFKVIPWHLSRRSLNLFREINTLLQVVKAYKHEQPDLVQHIALKPIIYGGWAARLVGGTPSVNAIAGMGHVFMSKAWQMRLLRPVLLILLRFALASKNARAVFQNEENRSFLVGKRVVSLTMTDIIRGTGIDIRQFVPRSEPAGTPMVLLASRMLWEKGIGEFVEAGGKLRERNVRARLVLVGKPDPENPGSIPEAQLRAWASADLIEWWGHQDDMAKIMTKASVVCLPSSYGEGIPRVLIEAAACGRAIIATDAPGCRDIVREGQNGFLVPLHNSEALAQAIETLVKNPELRASFGARGREIAVREFSEETIIAQMMAIYQRLLGSLWPTGSPNAHIGEDVASASRP
jgi:glycosyltransferase involved in cell wall biosynthesis